MVFNSAVLTAAIGLLKIGASPHLNPFVALVFGIGACTAWLGVRSIRKGNEYYHRAIYKKTLLFAANIAGMLAAIYLMTGTAICIPWP